MTPLAFLRTQEVQRLLSRAAKAAGTPLTIHYIHGDEEGTRHSSWGGCAACRFVAGVENGRSACRRSRLPAALQALEQRRAVPFLCHMGFTCLAAPALPEASFVLVFGPFCPAASAPVLEFDARAGIEALGLPVAETLPFSVGDIHVSPQGSIAAVAAWSIETLESWWREQEVEAPPAADPVPEEEIEPEPTARRPLRLLGPHPYSAPEIAAALMGKSQPQARQLLRSVLEEGDRKSLAAQRSRIRAAVMAVIEAAERAGAMQSAEKRLSPFLAEVEAAPDARALLNAALRALGALRNATPLRGRASGNATPVMRQFPELRRIVEARLLDGITLEEAASLLGETPTAISHRLRRKFGMSYSEYVGRLRMEKAKALLRRTQLSATDVALRVGIRDQSNFGKLFKKFEGISPLEYRRRHQTKRQPREA